MRSASKGTRRYNIFVAMPANRLVVCSFCQFVSGKLLNARSRYNRQRTFVSWRVGPGFEPFCHYTRFILLRKVRTFVFLSRPLFLFSCLMCTLSFEWTCNGTQLRSRIDFKMIIIIWRDGLWGLDTRIRRNPMGLLAISSCA